VFYIRARRFDAKCARGSLHQGLARIYGLTAPALHWRVRRGSVKPFLRPQLMNANRRKLIKGSLAAPMIFKLGPATGWAQAINSAGVCLQKSDVSVAEAGGAVTADADQWVRVPVSLLQLTQTAAGQDPVVLEGTYIQSFNQQIYYRVAVDNPG